MTESTSAHCFVTVDLDLNVGYVRFFRNGHLIGSAFQGLTGPISPTLSFIQVGAGGLRGGGAVSPGPAQLSRASPISPILPFVHLCALEDEAW